MSEPLTPEQAIDELESLLLYAGFADDEDGYEWIVTAVHFLIAHRMALRARLATLEAEARESRVECDQSAAALRAEIVRTATLKAAGERLAEVADNATPFMGGWIGYQEKRDLLEDALAVWQKAKEKAKEKANG